MTLEKMCEAGWEMFETILMEREKRKCADDLRAFSACREKRELIYVMVRSAFSAGMNRGKALCMKAFRETSENDLPCEEGGE